MRQIIIAVALTLLAVSAANAKCKSIGPLCQPGTGCEPKCITTSDGGPGRDNQYIDDRKEAQRRARERQHEFFQQRREAEAVRQQQFARQRQMQFYHERAAESSKPTEGGVPQSVSRGA